MKLVTAASPAIDPDPTTSHFHRVTRYNALVLSLGEGDATALQSKQQTD